MLKRWHLNAEVSEILRFRMLPHFLEGGIGDKHQIKGIPALRLRKLSERTCVGVKFQPRSLTSLEPALAIAARNQKIDIKRSSRVPMRRYRVTSDDQRS